MDVQNVLAMVVEVIGGLGIFLLGMRNMSDAMQAVAGEKIRKMISTVTDNRFIACGVGASVTSLIQSSSVTTVMVVGMVNAGLMTLRQSIGVIMGADIGTTITAWIIALNISDYGLHILGISAFFYLFSKNDRTRYTSLMFIGLGMVFFGLELMKGGFQPLRNDPEFIDLLSRFKPDNYWGIIKCIFVGAFTTAIIQSSSATVAITIALAKTGVIGYETAVALVLGENIGTTITAYLASIGATTNARRAAFAHIAIKVCGVMVLIPFFYHYVWLLNNVLSDNLAISARIAFAHTGFNVIIVSLFIGFISFFAKLVTFLVPPKAHEEKAHLSFLDVRMIETPVIAIQQSHEELVSMGSSIVKMFDWIRLSILDAKNIDSVEKKIFQREQILDVIQKEIVEFISKLMMARIPQSISNEATKQLRIADEYESISDYLVNVLKLLLRMRKHKMDFIAEGKDEILALHDSVAEFLVFTHQAVQSQNQEILSKASMHGESIKHKIKTNRISHLNRLAAKQTTPEMSLIYMDFLSLYRRIRDHILNAAEALYGEK